MDGLGEEDGRTFLNFKDRCSVKCELAVRNLKFEISIEGRLRFKCGRYLRCTKRTNCRYAKFEADGILSISASTEQAKMPSLERT